eukprot:g20900.t1
MEAAITIQQRLCFLQGKDFPVTRVRCCSSPRGGGEEEKRWRLDIQSLYTCIPHADGLKALRFFLFRRPEQRKGVAMGTRMGPSYTCLFVGYADQSLFRSYTG